MRFYVANEKKKKKKGKDEKWREINIIGLAGPLVSFGELRLSSIASPVIIQESRVRKKKTFPFLPLFLPLLVIFTQSLSPSPSRTRLCSFFSHLSSPLAHFSLIRPFRLIVFSGVYSRQLARDPLKHAIIALLVVFEV